MFADANVLLYAYHRSAGRRRHAVAGARTTRRWGFVSVPVGSVTSGIYGPAEPSSILMRRCRRLKAGPPASPASSTSPSSSFWPGDSPPGQTMHNQTHPSARSALICALKSLAGACAWVRRVLAAAPRLAINDGVLAEFAARHGVRRLALYGSALGPEFGPSSDIDLLVEFRPGHGPGLLHQAEMELELKKWLGRMVELRTYEDLSPFFRDDVAATARPTYAA